MRNLAFIFVFLLSVNSFAQNSKWTAEQIFDYSQKIAEINKNQIWNEFEPMKYTSFKSVAKENYISFSSNFDKPDNSFSWQLVDEYFSNNSLEDNLVITFHEAFHAFEADEKRSGEKWRRENSMLVFEYQESSARNNTLFSIEAKILRDALQTKGLGELKRKVQQFLAVRSLRQGEIEPRFVEFEKGAESNEGMAEYAGTKAVVEAMKPAKQKKLSIRFTFSNADAFLANKYELLGSITNIGKNIRRKFYYTGSAQGFLLDRLLKDWKTKVQMDSQAVQDLLETAVGKISSKAETEKILARYQYEKILIEEEKAVTKRKAENQALLENTLNQSGRKYTIDYSAVKTWVGIRNFDPMNVTMVSPKIRVHTRSVSFGAKDVFSAVFSQPVVEDLEKRNYVSIIPESDKETVTVDGAEIGLSKPTEIKFNQSLVIKSANFQLEATMGILKITDMEVLIKLYE